MSQIARKPYTVKSSGYLLNRFTLLVLLTGLILAAWFGQLVIVSILGVLLASAALANLWSRVSLVGVSCRRRLSQVHVFPGERIDFCLELVNRKLLPLPWIQVEDEVPLGLFTGKSLLPGDRSRYGLLAKSASLLWYSSITWTEQLLCQKRGYYRLGPMIMRSGDIFGFYPCSRGEPNIEHIIVYPRIFPVDKLDIPSQYFFGDITVRQRIFEDPVYVVGVREYSPRDSLRHINWKATARQGNLQVKIFEPTVMPQVAFFLSIDSFTQQGEIFNDADFEMAISAIASLTNYLNGLRCAAGVFVNSKAADTDKPIVLLPGSGLEQLSRILESLAKVTSIASDSFKIFLQMHIETLPWGTTLVVVIKKASPWLMEMLTGLKENGYKLMVLQAGDEKKPIQQGIPWLQIKSMPQSARLNFEEKI